MKKVRFSFLRKSIIYSSFLKSFFISVFCFSFVFDCRTGFCSIEESAAVNRQGQTSIDLLVFNIQKRKNKGWDSKLWNKLINDVDLVLLQEEILYKGEEFTSKGFSYDAFYLSWLNDSFSTGLRTLSNFNLIYSEKLISDQTEPIFGTPKLASVEIFNDLVKGQDVLIVNIHALNFKMNGAFYEQIDQVCDHIKEHQGPLIWAGDFNTWNKRRLAYLKDKTRLLGLEHVFFDEDRFFLDLDHVFQRGFRVKKAIVLNLNISDHRPLKLELEPF